VIYDAYGTQVAFNDDYNGLNSFVNDFTPLTSGTYYIEVRSYGGYFAGGYELSIASENVAPVLDTAAASLLPGTVNSPYHVSASQLLQGYTDADGDTLFISGAPTASAGVVTVNGDGWDITGLTSTRTVVLSYTVSDGNGHEVAASNSFAVTPAANQITMTRAGNDHTTEDGGAVTYTLALNNVLTAGWFSVVVSTTDESEDLLLANGTTTTSQTVVFDSTHSSYTITVQGVQDYDIDGTMSYRIQAHAQDPDLRCIGTR
jgi:hypothetical protein